MSGSPHPLFPPKKCGPVAGRSGWPCRLRRERVGGERAAAPSVGAPRVPLGVGRGLCSHCGHLVMGRGGAWLEVARPVPALLEWAALREMRVSTRATRGRHEGAALPLHANSANP
jgi:hypothetical protein